MTLGSGLINILSVLGRKFQEHEKSSREERAVHIFLRRFNFLISYSGLQQYKKKFAASWEPRYTVYRNVFDLPRLAIAVARVSELKGRRVIKEEEEMVDAAT